MLQQKAPQLNELFYCMSIENNKYPINPNSKHAKGKKPEKLFLFCKLTMYTVVAL